MLKLPIKQILNKDLFLCFYLKGKINKNFVGIYLEQFFHSEMILNMKNDTVE